MRSSNSYECNVHDRGVHRIGLGICNSRIDLLLKSDLIQTFSNPNPIRNYLFRILSDPKIIMVYLMLAKVALLLMYANYMKPQ